MVRTLCQPCARQRQYVHNSYPAGDRSECTSICGRDTPSGRPLLTESVLFYDVSPRLNRNSTDEPPDGGQPALLVAREERISIPRSKVYSALQNANPRMAPFRRRPPVRSLMASSLLVGYKALKSAQGVRGEPGPQGIS
jgi:hypothetical protein